MREAFRISRRHLLSGSAIAFIGLVPPAAALGLVSPRIVRRTDGFDMIAENALTEVRFPCAGVASVTRQPHLGERAVPLPFAAAGGISVSVAFEEDARVLRASISGVEVVADKRTGQLSFLDSGGNERLREDNSPRALPGVHTTARQGFRVGQTERLHGLGQFREPLPEYRNRDVFLAQANSDAINPFLVSSGGWGLLWDIGTAAYFRSRSDRLEYHSVGGRLIRYHVCLGESMDAVIKSYRNLTGAAALLPRWAYGYWQSKESYRQQSELLSVVKEFRRRRLPVDAMVLDYRYWGDSANFSGMEFDRSAFPDPKAMVDEVHDNGAHLIVSIWPAFGPATELYREMAASSHLLPGAHWSGGKVFDVSSADARRIYWRAIKRGLMDIGVDGLWTDGNEPELRSTGERYGTSASYAANGRIAAGSIDANLLTYSWYQAQGLSESMVRDLPEKRSVILTRSAYAGQQAFGAITWSGDIFASWGTLANQITAALNFSMAGIPWWTCDIGAFLVFHRYPEALDDPAYKELYVRWFQFGAFLPVFRAHGTHVPREPWQFGSPGDPFYDALAEALRLRYALLPYIYSLAAAAAFSGDTPMRAMVMDYPEDPGVRDQPATFCFGRDLLVRVVDRPLFHASRNMQEFIPNHAILGQSAPAATIAYYEGANFDRFVSRRLTDDIKMSWAGDLPSSLVGKPYSLRWAGRIVAQETGSTRISLIGKGHLKLLLDGRTVLEGQSDSSVADGATGAVSFRGHEGDVFLGVEVELVAGRSYDFVLEQRQTTPDSVSLWLEWITPSIRARQQLPQRAAVKVALPAGRDWYDFRTHERFAGGQVVEIDCPLTSHPVLARAGAIIPLARPGDHTAALPESLELRIYAGHDGALELYDDAGDGHGHLRGEAARIPIVWNEQESSLTIADRIGAYPGMQAMHNFEIKLIRSDGYTRSRQVTYNGYAHVITFDNHMT